MRNLLKFISIVILYLAVFQSITNAQALNEDPELDRRVEKVLAEGRWYDMNVPTRDGKLLYDLVIEGRISNRF